MATQGIGPDTAVSAVVSAQIIQGIARQGPFGFVGTNGMDANLTRLQVNVDVESSQVNFHDLANRRAGQPVDAGTFQPEYGIRTFTTTAMTTQRYHTDLLAEPDPPFDIRLQNILHMGRSLGNNLNGALFNAIKPAATETMRIRRTTGAAVPVGPGTIGRIGGSTGNRLAVTESDLVALYNTMRGREIPGRTGSSISDSYVLCLPNQMYADLTEIENFKRYSLTGVAGLPFTLEIGRLAGLWIFEMDHVLVGQVAASSPFAYTAVDEVRPTRSSYTTNVNNTEVGFCFNPALVGLDLQPLPVWTQTRTDSFKDVMVTGYRYMIGDIFYRPHTMLLVPGRA